MPRATVVLLAGAITFLTSAPAVARTGEGPLRAPQALDSHHVEAQLPGTGWAQVVGALAGTPALGLYRRVLRPGCEMEVYLSARLVRRAPKQRGRRLTVAPGVAGSLRFPVRRRGRYRAGRWWTGPVDERGIVIVVGAQRLPDSLRTARQPVLRTTVRFGANGLLEGCEGLVRRQAAGDAVRIGRSLRLVPGPVDPGGPITVA